MNPINRVGQKVVCVMPANVWLLGVCISLTDYPVKDRVYTVSGFENSLSHPGIHLTELSGITCPCKGLKDLAWPISAFRPVDERKTDISQFTKLTKPNDVTTRELEPV